jgi:multisubunit Na+/H+ antiporter MnhG subunit
MALVLVNPDMETLTITISIMEAQASAPLDNSQDRTPRTSLEAISIKITIIRIMFIQITQPMAAEKIAKTASQAGRNMSL